MIRSLRGDGEVTGTLTTGAVAAAGWLVVVVVVGGGGGRAALEGRLGKQDRTGGARRIGGTVPDRPAGAVDDQVPVGLYREISARMAGRLGAEQRGGAVVDDKVAIALHDRAAAGVPGGAAGPESGAGIVVEHQVAVGLHHQFVLLAGCIDRLTGDEGVAGHHRGRAVVGRPHRPAAARIQDQVAVVLDDEVGAAGRARIGRPQRLPRRVQQDQGAVALQQCMSADVASRATGPERALAGGAEQVEDQVAVTLHREFVVAIAGDQRLPGGQGLTAEQRVFGQRRGRARGEDADGRAERDQRLSSIAP